MRRKLSIVYKSLIDPYVEHIYKICDDVLAGFEELSAQEQTDHMMVFSEDGTNRIDDYVYDNYDSFRLLMKCGDSGKYADFIHNMVEREIQSTERYIEAMRKAGFGISDIDKTLLHMLSTGFFSSVFQIIEHDIDKDTAKKNISQLKEFQVGDWEKLMGIQFSQKP